MPDEGSSDSIPKQAIQKNTAGEPISTPSSPDNPATPITGAVSPQPDKQDIQDLKDEIRSAEKWMIGLTAAIAFFALCTIGVGLLQWDVMKGQLGEMKSGGTDTHDLAIAAKDQANRMGDLADQMKTQATRTRDLATQMKEQSERTKDLAETAQKSLEVENRPWLSAEVVKRDDPMDSGNIRFDREGNLSVTVTVKGKNFGKSMAEDIHVYAKLFATRIGNPSVETPRWQADVCDEPKIIYIRPGIPFFHGFERFPDEPYESGIGITLTKEDVRRESSFYADDPLQQRFIDRLYLLGCVDYRFSFRADRHQTRFAYDLVRIADANTKREFDGMPMMQFKVGSNLTKEQYWLAPSLHGGNYAY